MKVNRLVLSTVDFSWLQIEKSVNPHEFANNNFYTVFIDKRLYFAAL